MCFEKLMNVTKFLHMKTTVKNAIMSTNVGGRKFVREDDSLEKNCLVLFRTIVQGIIFI